MTNEAFEVRGSDGLVRRGVLSLPERGAPRAALILITAGVKYRTGPSQLYVSIARGLADRGFATLRYDAAGIGESDGLLDAGPSHIIFQAAERGRFVPDVELAFHTLADRLSPRTRIVVGGLCGGGLTAQIAAAGLKDPRLAGVLSFNIAVRHTATPGRQLAPVASEAKASLAATPRKVLKAESWRRLFSGALTVTQIRRTIAAALGRTQPNADAGLIAQFIPTFTQLMDRKVSQLLVFSGNDGRWAPFVDLIFNPVLRGKREGPSHSVRFIAEADHHLCWPEWRDQAIGWVAEWMSRL